jgi:uncharacterized delta-60 repeat protein
MLRKTVQEKLLRKWVAGWLGLGLWILGIGSTAAEVGSWSWTYGRSNHDDEAHAVARTSDGGYIVVGSLWVDSSSATDIWVLKLDSWGNVQWQKTYGGHTAYAVAPTSDGGYVVAGGGGLCSDVARVLKLDGSGNVLWHKTYGGSSCDEARAIAPTSDGGYVVAGWTTSFGADSFGDVWVLKLDGFGNVQWEKRYGGMKKDKAYVIAPTSDGGYVVAGVTESFGDTYYGDVWILKLNSVGGVEWQKTYGGTDRDEAYAIALTSDGGYVMAGMTRSFGDVAGDVWVLKLDRFGNVQWQKRYGRDYYTDYAYAIAPTLDGGYVVAGKTYSSGGVGGGGYDVWVLKLDSSGNVQWQWTYGGERNDEAHAVVPAFDGGYVVVGITESFGAGWEDAWILKLNADGTLSSSCSVTSTRTAVQGINTNATIVPTSVGGVNTTAIVQLPEVRIRVPDDYDAIAQCPMLSPKNLSIQDPNGNGVWDSGETVTVIPVWRHPWLMGVPAMATGMASSVETPSGVTAFLTDPIADYGTISPGGTTDCQAATGNCYGITGSRTVWGHRDVTFEEGVNGTFGGVGVNRTFTKRWTLHVGPSFADVPVTAPYYRHVETLLHRGITGGCTEMTYCPTNSVNRAQMAIFISRAVLGGDPPAAGSGPGGSWDCTDGLPNHFTDVPDGVSYCRHVHWMWANNIAGGCTATTYCPTDSVSRAQMAIFISRAVWGGDPPAAGSGPNGSWNCTDGLPNHFTDVPDGAFYCPHVHWMWANNITGGCTATTYCPGDPVNRAQMAVFLVRAFQLVLYGL